MIYILAVLVRFIIRQIIEYAFFIESRTEVFFMQTESRSSCMPYSNFQAEKLNFICRYDNIIMAAE